MYSTVGDLGRAISQMATGSTLRDKGRTELSNWVKTGNSDRYGFCIAEVQGGIGHTGDVPGFNAVAAYFPKLQKSVVVMTNLSNNKDGKTMPAEELLKLILDNLR
jgi:D-alanyl-D-alanine carboxypeptidase